MTSSIPNGFSMQELQQMLDTAAKNPEPSTPEGEGPFGDQGLTIDQLENLCEKVIDDSLEECNDPMLHKLIMLTLAMRFGKWHDHVAEQCRNRGEDAAAAAWQRDAGKFQAVMDILCSISIGPDDYTCNHGSCDHDHE